jgi:shikimate kinase
VRAVALVGPRAAGKSTAGALLAQRLGFAFVDSDERLAQVHGMAAGEQLARHGEVEFRRREAAVVLPLLASADRVVLALGGGAVTTASIRAALLRPGLAVVLLTADPAVLAARIAKSPGTRPPLTALPAQQEVEELLRQRAPFYAAVAQHRVDTSTGSVESAVAAIAAALGC